MNGCLEAFAVHAFPAPIDGAPVDIRPILERAVAHGGPDGKAVHVALAAPALPSLPCDRDLLAFAFDALIDNAVRASAPGGEVVVKARASSDDIFIEVADHGTGIPPEVLRHVFEIGYSTWGGAGLGLTVAKFIVYHHSGGFSIASRVGQGTTISVVLPVRGEGESVDDE
jgi:signal transduction histidine kinase